MEKQIPRQLLFLILFCLVAIGLPPEARAQARTVRGTVTSQSDGLPLPGVNILVQGTTLGTTSTTDGQYAIDVTTDTDVLVFSFIGFRTLEVTVGDRDMIDVALEDDIAELDAVVVTALGVERRSRDLGYSLQSVDVAGLEAVQDVNLTNALSGRVAGVQINSGSSGPGSSSRIVIRGESSFTDNVQPMIVVDGVPISNSILSNDVFNDGTGFHEVDYGNGLAELSLDDISTINVLKGPAAMALYGSRGANGVLVLTTRTSRRTPGIGVRFNSSATFEDPLRLPQYQDVYGQGSNGQFSYLNGLYDGVEDGEDISWGPRMDGQLINQFDSPARAVDGSMVRAGDVIMRGGTMDRSMLPNGEITATPWTPNPNNVEDFFETGMTVRNNLALSGNNDLGYYRLSYSNVFNEGIIPGTDLERHGVAFSGGYDLTDRLHAHTFVNYINSSSKNRPSTGYGSENPMYIFTWYSRQIGTDALKDYRQAGQEDIQQFNYNYAWHDNPFFALIENRNGYDKDRVLGNLAVTYTFTPKLELTVRAGLDTYDDLRKSRRAFSTQRFRNGAYREDNIEFAELNTDFLLRYNTTAGPDWTLKASVGGNRMDQTARYKAVTAGELIVPGIYNLENARIPLPVSRQRAGRQPGQLHRSRMLTHVRMLPKRICRHRG